ncbi:hypothetical protein [Spiroplasma endosymbiont of Megaselia nigra]|uniref:hypothetical protein n=1 Tax=Spiroplasma endosymbiont of Megaselia nigra TaxID=2478537 RepID=UPI0018AD45C6|nr:hypothetical protein [Spiroplasma endosymbiont of Megaselia nigra]
MSAVSGNCPEFSAVTVPKIRRIKDLLPVLSKAIAARISWLIALFLLIFSLNCWIKILSNGLTLIHRA